MKVSPGQEFVYSGTFEMKITGSGGGRTIAAPIKISALVKEADPAKGYGVVVMRQVQPEVKAGEPAVPADASVATIQYNADLKATTPPGDLGGPTSIIAHAMSVPFGPKKELKSGDEWRQSEALPGLPLPPQEHVYRVAGEMKVGDRTCLKIEKKLAQSLPLKQEVGGGTLELQEYEQTRCIDPETGIVVSDTMRQRGRHSAGNQQTNMELIAAITLQETLQHAGEELASRVKQAAVIDRIQNNLFTFNAGADRKNLLEEASREIAAFQKEYPKSPFAPALTRFGAAVTQMRAMAQREARLQGLKGKPAPAFALKDLAGKEQTLAAYRGKLILLNFFASW